MQLHELKRNTPNKKEKTIGRGKKRGKTSGRGGKGQTARAGNKKRPQMRDVIKKLPKLRGYKFHSIIEKRTVVNLGSLAGAPSGTIINPEFLLKNKLIRRVGGKLPVVKILGLGDINTKLSFSKVIVSGSAKVKIEKAGGSIEK